LTDEESAEATIGRQFLTRGVPEMRFTICRLLTILLVVLNCSVAMAQGTTIPKYLELARELVQNVKPENNLYYYKAGRYVHFPSDAPDSEYSVHTDCVGLVEALLQRGKNISVRFSIKKYPNRYSIIDWVDGVERGEMFDKVERIQDVKPGDLFMWKYLKNFDPVFHGHIVIIDTVPCLIKPQHAPIAANFLQWEVWIIDSSPYAASPDDTRYIQGEPLKKTTGAGRGRIYIYTDKSGVIKGRAYAFDNTRVFWHEDDFHMVMARPRIKED
jgi:hypothetical protein